MTQLMALFFLVFLHYFSKMLFSNENFFLSKFRYYLTNGAFLIENSFFSIHYESFTAKGIKTLILSMLKAKSDAECSIKKQNL